MFELFPIQVHIHFIIHVRWARAYFSPGNNELLSDVISNIALLMAFVPTWIHFQIFYRIEFPFHYGSFCVHFSFREMKQNETNNNGYRIRIARIKNCALHIVNCTLNSLTLITNDENSFLFLLECIVLSIDG